MGGVTKWEAPVTADMHHKTRPASGVQGWDKCAQILTDSLPAAGLPWAAEPTAAGQWRGCWWVPARSRCRRGATSIYAEEGGGQSADAGAVSTRVGVMGPRGRARHSSVPPLLGHTMRGEILRIRNS